MAQTLTPVGRRVLIKRTPAEEKIGSLYIPDAAKEKPQLAEVRALGKGYDDEGRDVASLFVVRVGDQIMIPRYGGQEVRINDEDLVIIPESDVLGILE